MKKSFLTIMLLFLTSCSFFTPYPTDFTISGPENILLKVGETYELKITTDPVKSNAPLSYTYNNEILSIRDSIITALEIGVDVVTANIRQLKKSITVSVIAANENDILDVPKPDIKNLDIPQGNLILNEWDFDLLSEGATKEISFTTATSNGAYLEKGLFRFETNKGVWWTITDQFGNRVYQSQSGGIITGKQYESVIELTLQTGIRYDFVLLKGTYNGSYNFKIYGPNGNANLTTYTNISDRFWFENQRAYYTYTAPVTGKYQFETNIALIWDIKDSNNNKVFETDYNWINDYYSTSKAILLNLKKGVTYNFTARKQGDSGVYTLQIYQPNPVIDISEKIQVFDSFRFLKQENEYIYTPRKTGTIKLRFNQKMSFEITDDYGNSVKLTTTKDDYTRLLSVTANTTYKIKAKGEYATGNYFIAII